MILPTPGMVLTLGRLEKEGVQCRCRFIATVTFGFCNTVWKKVRHCDRDRGKSSCWNREIRIENALQFSLAKRIPYHCAHYIQTQHAYA